MRSLYSLVLCLSLLAPTISYAENPLEYILRTNGWGWSDGYHSRNGCARVGTSRNAFVPVVQAPTWQPAPQVYHQPQYQPQPQPGYRPPQQPTPAPRPEAIPPAMRGPMMNAPANTMDNRNAQRYYRSW